MDNGITNGQRQIAVTGFDHSAATYQLDLLGQYQLRNLPAVLATVNWLQATFPVSETALDAGLATAAVSTGLKGRFQILRQSPLVIADTAHNEAGLRVLFDMIDTYPRRVLRIVLGLVADKDRASVLAVLPTGAVYYFCQAQTPRALATDLLQAEAAVVGLTGAGFPDVDTALQVALSQSTPDDLLVITGSNYIIAELTDL